MSYARFGWDNSDVYVFLDVGGYLTCCGCILEPSGPDPLAFSSARFHTTAEMLAHLDEHRAAGHCVAEETIESLRADADENDQWIVEAQTKLASE